MFARTPRAVRVFEKKWTSFSIACRDEVRAFRNHTRVKFRALLDVRLNKKLPAWLEQSRHFREAGIAHDEAFCMALFPPRIRKMQKDALHAATRTKARERKPCVLAKYSGVRAEASFRKSLIAHGRPFASDLEPHDQRFRGRLRPLKQKPRLRSRTDLEFEMLSLAKRPKIDALCIRQPGCMCVRVEATLSGAFVPKCRGVWRIFRTHGVRN
jgi:hypothetical protein